MKKGFTLIELLIAVSIIILLSGLSFASYNSFNEQKKLDDESSTLVNVLNLASKKASAADLPNSCSNFTGYEVDFFNGASSCNSNCTSYKLEFCCSGSCSSTQTYSVSSNITISLSNLAQYVHYNPLVSGTSTTLTNPLTVTIRNSSIATCIDVSINQAGAVSAGSKYKC